MGRAMRELLRKSNMPSLSTLGNQDLMEDSQYLCPQQAQCQIVILEEIVFTILSQEL